MRIEITAGSALVLGHYLYAPFFGISLKIHLFIFFEAAMSLLLLLYVSVLVFNERRR